MKNYLNNLDDKFINFYHSIKYLQHSSIKQSPTVFNFIDYEEWLIISKKLKNTIDKNSELKEKIIKIYFQDQELYLESIKNKNINLPVGYIF